MAATLALSILAAACGGVRVGTAPCDGLATTGGSVWVVDCEHGRLLKIDRHGHITDRIDVQPVDEEGQIVSDGAGIWMPIRTDQFDKVELVHVNAVTDEIDIRTPLPAGAVAVTSDPRGNLWVSNYDRSTVSLLTAEGALVKDVDVPSGPRFLAASPGAVWVLSQIDGSLSRVDLHTFEVRTLPLNVPGDGGFVAYGLRSVWVSVQNTPLIKVNPVTFRVEERYTGVGGDYISTALGSVWLSNRELGDVWRLSPGESS